jgi:hypothetical protein
MYPVAVFSYNRPQHLEQCLQSLAQCRRLDECRIYIFSDGAKHENDQGILETRKVIQDWQEVLRADVYCQDKNIGLANSIVFGVSMLCDLYGKAIVIEDDLVLRRDFLDYMIQSLDQYENNPRVFQVSAYIQPIKSVDSAEVFFLPLVASWGWATWKRAWQLYDGSTQDAEKILLANPRIKRKFDLDDSYPYSTMVLNRFTGKNDIWDAVWGWVVFKNHGLVLYPRSSLVWNGGFDGTGIHCGTNSPFTDEPHFAEEFDGKITFPRSVKVDRRRFSLVKKYFRERSGKKTPFQKFTFRVRRRVKTLIHI